MASTLGFAFQKEDVGVRHPPVGIISSASPFNKGLSLKDVIQDTREWMEVEISSNVKFFSLYLRGRKPEVGTT